MNKTFGTLFAVIRYGMSDSVQVKLSLIFSAVALILVGSARMSGF